MVGHLMRINNNYKAVINSNSEKLPVLFKSILVGLSVGIVITAYRLTLMEAEELSFRLYHYLRNNVMLIPIAFIVLGAVGFLIGTLVSKYRMISGSGIPQVKGVIMGYFKNNWLSTLIAKFFGGAVSILAGLSLGREGPSVQLAFPL
jgi:H+/Cl- antiporter ClcA